MARVLHTRPDWGIQWFHRFGLLDDWSHAVQTICFRQTVVFSNRLSGNQFVPVQPSSGSPMKFFNIDFHISVIADIKSLFAELGHSVDTRSLSNHTWVFGRDMDLVPGLDGMSTTSFGQSECDRFYKHERNNLEQYDGFIVTHT